MARERLSAGQPASTGGPSARFAAAAVAASPITLAPIGEAPSVDPKSREEKRFARADKDDDGRIILAELG